MARIKKFSDYVNEDYSFKGAMQKGKEFFSKAGGWLSGFLAKLKEGIFPTIPEGPKAGAPMVAYFRADGKKSITSQIQDLYGGSAKESAETDIDLDNQQIEEGMTELEWHGTGIVNVGAEELKELVKERYDFLIEGSDNMPIFIFGAPGIGKTQIVGQACQELGVDLMTIDLQFMDPADFLGVPEVRKVASDDPLASGVTVSNPPKWLPRDNGPEGKGGILFFDELNRANLPVRTGMMNLAQGRRVNEYNLPDKWVIIAAGNRPQDDPGAVEDMSTALSTRFLQYNFVPTFKGFKDYVTGSEHTVKKTGLMPREIVLPELLSFLEFSDEFFHNLNPDQPSVVFATPRGWIDASTTLYAKMKRLEKQGKIGNELSREDLTRIFQPSVGLKAASAFAKFYEVVQSIPLADVMKVFDEPEKAPIPKPIQKSEPGKFNTTYEPDIMFATIAAIVSKSEKIKPLTPQQYSNAVDYAIRLDSASYGASFISMLNSKHDYIKTDRAYTMHLKKFTQHYGL
jgi:hypothetical protein